MIEKILKNIEGQKIYIGNWLVGFTGIVLIRCLLEALSNHSSSGIIAADSGTLVHYTLCYFTILIGLTLIIYLFTGNKNIYKSALFGALIIWFAPTFDLISTAGRGVPMAYFFEGNVELLKSFLTFFLPHADQGISPGIRVEIALILLGIGWYVMHFRKKISVALVAIICSFVFIFSMISLPGVVYTISHPSFSGTSQRETISFLNKSISNSNIKLNAVHGTLIPINNIRRFELGFNKLISQIYIILSFVFLVILFWKMEREKFRAVIKNSRPERVGFYFVLLGLGMFGAFIQELGGITSWVDILSILVLALSWYSAWMFAVHVNDVEDEQIDAISNKDRPVVANQLTPKEMKEVGLIWLAISLVSSFAVGYYPFFMNLVFTASYYIYSAAPLRLKRVPVLSSFLISLACLSTILAGFFFLSENKDLTIFPVMLALGIIIMFTLAVNVRDVKDIEGDRACGINTLPVLFGKNGIKLTATLLAVSFLLLPLFLAFYKLFFIAIPASVVGYKLVTRNPYNEKYIFYLYFIFMTTLVVMYQYFK